MNPDGPGTPPGPVIVPRWEWRAFGDRFGPADAAFAAMPSDRVMESDELYLLSPEGATVKVRDDLMDVKALRDVDADGLERWEPVMKAAFPISAEDATRVVAALRVDVAPLERDRYSLDEFLKDVTGPSGSVRAVKVHKRRVRYTVGGCTSEVTDVVADGPATRTIAIEAPDAAAVVAAVRSVGLQDYINTNYPRGLRAILDGRPARYGVIDVGTNSVKFYLAERGPDGWRTVDDRAVVTRLGEGMEDRGEIVSAAADRTIDAIQAMVEEARASGAVAIAAVGTAGLRAARNQAAVIAAIHARTNLWLEVISGDEEGRLAYVATTALLGMDGGSTVVFDSGGGSTQFTFGHDGQIDRRFSVPVGAVGYTERFRLQGVVLEADLSAARSAIAADLAAIDDATRPDALVAMGGAVTNMAAVMHHLAVYDPAVIRRTVLDRAEIERQIELYRSLDTEARRAVVGLQPARAEVILAGACIVRSILAKLGAESLTVSDRGLRHGLLVERFPHPT